MLSTGLSGLLALARDQFKNKHAAQDLHESIDVST